MTGALQGDRRAQPRSARLPAQLPRARLGAQAARRRTAERPAHAYTVQPNDTLSDIAQDELGDADRWPEIYEASTGITQPGGAQLTDPDVIDVGWKLNIPGAEQPARQDNQHAAAARGQARDPRRTQRRAAAGRPAGRGGARRSRRRPKRPRRPHLRPRSRRPKSPPPAAADVDQVDDADDSDPRRALGPRRSHRRGRAAVRGAADGAAVASAGRSSATGRPGRAVAAPPPELAPVEMTLNATGAAAAATVEFADEALRRLAATVGARAARCRRWRPSSSAQGRLTLHLSAPTAAPAPWVGSPDQTHWHVSTDTDVEDLGPDTGVRRAALPAPGHHRHERHRGDLAAELRGALHAHHQRRPHLRPRLRPPPRRSAGRQPVVAPRPGRLHRRRRGNRRHGRADQLLPDRCGRDRR